MARPLLRILLALLLLSGFRGSAHAQRVSLRDSTPRSAPVKQSSALRHLEFRLSTAEEGAPANGIDAIAQDSLGFLWLGTRNGLFRYDGFSFEAFRHDPDDPSSLPHQWVTALCVDSGGLLWIGTVGGGLSRFDPDAETFVRIRHDPEDADTLSTDVITQILEDDTGALWIGTHTGLGHLDPQSGAVTHYRHDAEDPSSLSHDRVRALLIDRAGTLWVGTGNPFANASPGGAGGLNRFDRETGTFTRYLHDADDASSLISNKVQALFEDSDGNFWVGTMGNVLHRMDRMAGTFTRYRYDASGTRMMIEDDRLTLSPSCDADACGIISFVDEDAAGTLLIGAFRQGLLTYDSRTEDVRLYDSAELATLDHLWSTATTRDGTRWMGGFDPGLVRVTAAAGDFPHFVHEPGDAGSLSHNSVWGIQADTSGVLWIATKGGGLNRFEPSTGTFTPFRHEAENPRSLSSDSLYSVVDDGSGGLWVGTFGAGLNHLDKATGEVTRYPHDPANSRSLSYPWVTDVLEDDAGTVWVATWGGGVNRLDRDTGTFTHYRHDPDDDSSISHDQVFTLAQDSHGTLWFGGNRRLDRFDPVSGTSTLSLPHSWHYQIVEDRSGRLWLADHVTGLHVLAADGTTVHYAAPQRLPGRDIAAAVEDDFGYLWVTTFDGDAQFAVSGSLARFDVDRRSFRLLTAADGLPDIPFTLTSGAKARDGTLYFGGPYGFIAVDPANFQERVVPPVSEVVLRRLRLFNSSVMPGPEGPLRQSLHGATEIVFTHKEHDFTIHYGAIDFGNRGALQYQYKLENHDQDWVEAREQRSARYSRIAPGEYVFLVRATRPGEAWPEPATSIAIVMLPPWWKTAWAYALYGLLFLASVYGVDRIQRRRVVRRERDDARERELEQKHEIETAYRQLEQSHVELEVAQQKLIEQARLLGEMGEMKSRFFANVSHEFRTPLTLVLGPVRDLLEGRITPQRLADQAPLMHRSASRLLHLINQLLDLSRLEAGGMQLHIGRGDIVSFVRRHVLAFTSHCEREGITLVFSAEPEVIEAAYDADKLEKVISNVLSNAFKFTPSGGRIRVTVRKGADFVEVRVRDSGEGIAAGELPLVFDRFYQVDLSSTRRHEGSGIGLSLTKELVELHGGTITAESERGFGSTFTIRLPLPAEQADSVPAALPKSPDENAGDAYASAELPTEAGPQADEDERSDAAAPSGAATILIVEDNADMRRYLRSHLANSYRLIEAEDGCDGLRKAREHHPDLVISDVMMPEMDGFKLCEMIKSDEALNHIPVVLLTARADEASRIEGLQTGADDYLPKPFSVAELTIRVENLVKIRRRLRGRYSDVVRIGPAEIVVDSADAVFAKRVRDLVEQQMGDSEFDVARMAEELGISERQLHRRVKETVDLTPGGYIRMMRLERASQLLEQQAGRVSDVAYAVGFKSPKYFSRLFRQTFGRPPSDASGEDLD